MKPSDVSELEHIVGIWALKLVKLVALCALLFVLQALLALLNPANPASERPPDKGHAKAVYLGCVRQSKTLYGTEWSLAIKECQERYTEAVNEAKRYSYKAS